MGILIEKLSDVSSNVIFYSKCEIWIAFRGVVIKWIIKKIKQNHLRWNNKILNKNNY